MAKRSDVQLEEVGEPFRIDFDTLHNFLRTEKYCDVYLQSTVRDSKAIIACHKVVLATISPFFRQKFGEEEIQTLYLKEVDEGTLKLLINYIYSGGGITLTAENVFQVASGAQELMLKQLHKKCSNFIKNLVSVKDVINVLKFAQSQFNDELTNTCVNFILTNFQKVRGQGFLDLDAVRLKLIIDRQRQRQETRSASTQDILEAVVEWLHKDPEVRKEHAFYLIKDIPLAEINVQILRKLLREDSFMRSIQVVYSLYVDAVEEIGMKSRTENKLKRNTKDISRSGKEEGAAFSKPELSKRHRLQPMTIKIDLKHLTPILASKPDTVCNDNGAWMDSGGKVKNGIVYFVSFGLLNSETKSIASLNLETKQVQILATHPDFDALGSLIYHRGKIYCLGGVEIRDSERFNTVAIFDVHTKTWEKNAPDNTSVRAGFKSVRLGDSIYAVEGASLKGTTTEVERLSLQLDCYPLQKWSTVANLTYPRYDFAACAVKGHIYVIGGWAWNKTSQVMLSISNTIECYSPVSDEWLLKSPMPNGRRGLAVAAFGQYLSALGGGNLHGVITNTVDVYDTLEDCWSTGIPMKTKRQYFSAIAHNGYIYVIGGDSDDSPTMEKFDIEHQVWDDMGPLPINGFFNSVDFLSEGFIKTE